MNDLVEHQDVYNFRFGKHSNSLMRNQDQTKRRPFDCHQMNFKPLTCTENCYTCKQCAFVTNSLIFLFKHVNDQCQSLRCDQCEHSSKTAGGLYSHKWRMHLSSKERKKCDKCNYTCKALYQLKLHKLHKHSNQRPHYCHKCKYTAKTKNHLKTHVYNKHTNDDEIQWLRCDQCEYKCKMANNLKQHKGSKHTISDQIRWLRCDQCEYKSRVASNLKNHKYVKHTEDSDINWLKCERCEYKCKMPYQLRLHRIQHTNKEKEARIQEMESTAESPSKRIILKTYSRKK